MKNRKRPLVNVSPPRPREYSELERILITAAGATELPWKSLTFKLQQGHSPVIQIEMHATLEDLAAAVEIKANDQ